MIARLKQNIGRLLFTAAMLACAAFFAHHLWDYYFNAPWTRDGRITADVVLIAPEVSGTIADVKVADNQFVHQGDVLFSISPERFQLVVDAAKATLDSKTETMKLKQSVAKRAQRLSNTGSISAENSEQATRQAAAASAEVKSAEVALSVANLDLKRTEVKAPVDGYVTNLHLRKGDYAVSGKGAVTLLDATSFRVTGYFRETQLGRIHTGDPVRVQLMGFSSDLNGHVESFGRGIADANIAANSQGLPAVNPVFDWVRLAQRIPVRITLDDPPSDVALAAGMTASIYVDETAKKETATAEISNGTTQSQHAIQ